MADTTAFELRPCRQSDVRRWAWSLPREPSLFGVLPRHAPLISTLQRGIVEVHENGSVSERIMVDGGIADVTETRRTILAERAESLPQTVAEIKTALPKQKPTAMRTRSPFSMRFSLPSIIVIC